MDNSANPYVVKGPMLRELAQGLLEARKYARSLENISEAYIPLISNPDDKSIGQDTWARLDTIRANAREIDELVHNLYNAVAKEAMKDA